MAMRERLDGKRNSEIFPDPLRARADARRVARLRGRKGKRVSRAVARETAAAGRRGHAARATGRARHRRRRGDIGTGEERRAHALGHRPGGSHRRHHAERRGATRQAVPGCVPACGATSSAWRPRRAWRSRMPRWASRPREARACGAWRLPRRSRRRRSRLSIRRRTRPIGTSRHFSTARAAGWRTQGTRNDGVRHSAADRADAGEAGRRDPVRRWVPVRAEVGWLSRDRVPRRDGRVHPEPRPAAARPVLSRAARALPRAAARRVRHRRRDRDCHAARARLRRAAAAAASGRVARREAGEGDAGGVRRVRSAGGRAARILREQPQSERRARLEALLADERAADLSDADDARSRRRGRMARAVRGRRPRRRDRQARGTAPTSPASAR